MIEEENKTKFIEEDFELEEDFTDKESSDDDDEPILPASLSAEAAEVIRRLYNVAKKKHIIVLQEIKDAFEESDLDATSFELCVNFLKDHDINIVEEYDEILELKNEKVQVDERRIDDPVRLYLKEMGSIPLLSREEEVAIAKDIERGKKGMLSALIRMSCGLDEMIKLLSFVVIANDDLNPVEEEILEEVAKEIGIEADEDEGQDHSQELEQIYNMCLQLRADFDNKEKQEQLLELLHNLDAIYLTKIVIAISALAGLINDFDAKLMEIANKHFGYSRSDFFNLIKEKHNFGGSLEDGSKAWQEFMKKLNASEEISSIKKQLKSIEERVDMPIYNFKKVYSEFMLYKDQVTKARKIMVESNLRLVISIAKRYTNKGLQFLDLIQEGNIGLMKAVDKFQYDRGFKFSTYATWWIRQSTTRAIADQARTIRIPVHMIETFNKIGRVSRRFLNETGREATEQELADKLSMSVEKIRKVMRIAKEPVSMNAPIGDEEDSNLGDLLEDKSLVSTFDMAMQSSIKEAITKALSTLSAREDRLIRMRFGIGTRREHTLEEVGKKFKVTRERIRQLESKLLRKMSLPGRSRKLRDFILG